MANTAFSVHITNALTMCDRPTTKATDIANIKLFINQTLQDLYKTSARRLLQDIGTIATVASQAYVALANATLAINSGNGFSIDEISRIYQTTDDVYLERWTPQQYRAIFPDTSNASGNPTAYARWANDRLYLYPRPASVINLLIDCWIQCPALSLNGDLSLIPPKFDEVILQGARYRWFQFVEPDDSQKIKTFKSIYDELKKEMELELDRDPDRISISNGHMAEVMGVFDLSRLAKRPAGIS